MAFIDNLHRICQERGTTVTGCLKALGWSTNKVTIWNGGTLPKEDQMVALADLLRCTVMDFFDDDPMSETPFTHTDEDELEILTIYRKLNRRGKHAFMAMVYKFEEHPEMLS